ncbi:NAD(P)/FAD-dependent oxidoreductase [Sinorhizobium saheli]|uniref:Ferredoxin reductase n=1 Tax=Sinorhizobium saheli TaxID=36856 RepID=A0A178YKE7_SINSA|nr:FAD-dependent oxidoreductase [Sinorhizobium saheli]MQW86939.1 FAD-dependent oxidoreductase [Sinorhizobium saheli]OAP47962.1 hypothetical protein ATB98_00955 [Sinorhizobium saheli]
MRKIAIVGAGQAGAASALKLRELGFDGQVFLFGDEGLPPYERPELSKAYALGLTAFEQLVLLPPELAEARDITLRVTSPVRRIDRVARRVEIESGSYSFDVLILATGGRARRLPLPAAFAGRSLSIRTKADADRLREVVREAATVAVVGGGWLGTEAAMTTRGLGASVDLVEMGPRLCGRVAPDWLSRRLEEMQQAAGVRVHLNARPSFNEDGTITIADRQLSPDLLIEAIGMDANDDLARAAGLRCASGVLVDGFGRTDDENVFAIGDCATTVLADGRCIRLESWQNANRSAERAVRAVLRLPDMPPEPDWFWTTQGKDKIHMLGQCPDNAVQIDRPGPGGRTSRIFMQGDRMIGCIAINNPREISEARRVLSADRPLDPVRVGNPGVMLSHCAVDQREAVTVG